VILQRRLPRRSETAGGVDAAADVFFKGSCRIAILYNLSR
jgi:hypothetical protein